MYKSIFPSCVSFRPVVHTIIVIINENETRHCMLFFPSLINIILFEFGGCETSRRVVSLYWCLYQHHKFPSFTTTCLCLCVFIIIRGCYTSSVFVCMSVKHQPTDCVHTIAVVDKVQEVCVSVVGT